MVSPIAEGDRARANRAAPQSGEPTRGEARDVEVRQEATAPSTPTSFDETFCRNSSCDLERFTIELHMETVAGVGTPTPEIPCFIRSLLVDCADEFAVCIRWFTGVGVPTPATVSICNASGIRSNELIRG